MRNWIWGVGSLLLIMPALGGGCGGDEGGETDDGGGTVEGGTSGTGTGTGGTGVTGGTGGTGAAASGGSAGTGTSGAGGAGVCPDQPPLFGDTSCDDEGVQCDYSSGPGGGQQCVCTDGNWECDPTGAGGAAGAPGDACPSSAPDDGDSCSYAGPPCDYAGGVECDCQPWNNEWSCTGGGQGGAAAGGCPASEPGDGDACDGMQGESCDYPGGTTCDCQGGRNPEWTCG